VHILATMPRSKPAAHYQNQSGTSGGYAALRHKKQTAELAKRRLEMVVKELKDDKKAVENEKKTVESDKRKFEKKINELSKKLDKHDTSLQLLREFAHTYKRCTFMQVLISEMKGSSKFKQLVTLFQV
jgi:predicted  nucleic acid-binding Zn-ribbon protein